MSVGQTVEELSQLEHLGEDAPAWWAYKRQGDMGARDRLILKHASLVKHIAGRLAVGMPQEVLASDLETYGIFGLLEAMERFDENRGIKFETYAVVRIRGAILDGLRQMDWVPASVRRRARQVEEAYNHLYTTLGRAATDEEMAEYMEMDLDSFQDLLAQVSTLSLVYLDEIWGTEDEDGRPTALRDFIADEDSADPLEQVEWNEKREVLAEAIERLPDKERLVVSLHYYEGLTLVEISRILDLSASRISQLHSKAILRLRGYLGRHKALFA